MKKESSKDAKCTGNSKPTVTVATKVNRRLSEFWGGQEFSWQLGLLKDTNPVKRGLQVSANLVFFPGLWSTCVRLQHVLFNRNGPQPFEWQARKSNQCEIISEESIIIPDYFPDAGSRPDSHGLIGALFSPPEEKAEQGTDYMLQATELILGGFQPTLPAWLQKLSNKRVSGPTRSHGVNCKVDLWFFKGCGSQFSHCGLFSWSCARIIPPQIWISHNRNAQTRGGGGFWGGVLS